MLVPLRDSGRRTRPTRWLARGGQDAVVDRLDHPRMLVGREAASGLPSGRLRDVGGELRVAQEAVNEFGHCRVVARRDEEPGAAGLDDLAWSPGVGRDDRTSYQHGLDDDAAEGLGVDARVDDDVEPPERLWHVLHETGEDHTVRNAERSGQRAKILGVRFAPG